MPPASNTHLPSWLTPFATAGQALLDLLYPPRCPGCGKLGEWFCAACRAQIVYIQPPVCCRCGHPIAQSGLCPECRRTPSALDAIISVAVFAPPLRPAIHNFKYQGARSLVGPLAAPMIDAWRAQRLTADLLVPVPLHPAREAERGYNQAALLACELSAAVNIPLALDLARRTRATAPQVGMSRTERQQNVYDAFECGSGARDKRIVLVDDVCTTGATLEACAAALRRAGAREVWGFTLARAKWEPDESMI